jgi:hypothetical protein
MKKPENIENNKIYIYILRPMKSKSAIHELTNLQVNVQLTETCCIFGSSEETNGSAGGDSQSERRVVHFIVNFDHI